MATGLDARVRKLEEAQPAADGPRLIVLVAMLRRGASPATLRRLSILGTIVERTPDESDDDFRVRAEAYAASRNPNGATLAAALVDRAPE
ncbi:MAG: hypothetical protein HUU30_04030 [Burkholderiaceae bacterium]|nr:hypothetical protein [Aquabacterium sp.]NUP84909.1 hypothetical protein [Burkholderiaceae bacterium]